jgi:hypothetical protein
MAVDAGGSAAAAVTGAGGTAAVLEAGASFPRQPTPAAAIAIAPIVSHEDPAILMTRS